MERDEPLTPGGRFFLQPQLDQVINAAVAVEFPLDVDAIKAAVKESVIPKHPRFCSLFVRNSRGREYWRRTDVVDIDRHIIVRNLPLSDDPSVSDEDAVNDFMADLSVSSPLPTDKPLWEIHLLMAHRTMLFRFHHALGDGISLMSMTMSCCRRVDDPAKPPTIAGVGAAAPRRWSLWTLLMVVWYTLVYVVEFALRTLWVRDKVSSVRGGAGVELWPRKIATARFRLDDMKRVKQAIADATLNDVLFGVISCGLSRYLDTMESSKALVEGQQITGLAMVNLRSQSGLQDLSKLMESRSGTRWGNKFGIVLLPIHYHKGSSDPIQFVKRAKAMIDKKKLSLEAPFAYTIGCLLMSLFGPRVNGEHVPDDVNIVVWKIACLLNYRIICNTTFTLSNVVGPKEEMTAAGNPVKHIRVTSSSLPHAITMHMVSYAGVADLQILVAKEIIPDPKLLATCFENALLQMKKTAATAINLKETV